MLFSIDDHFLYKSLGSVSVVTLKSRVRISTRSTDLKNSFSKMCRVRMHSQVLCGVILQKFSFLQKKFE